jgi:hypothetical protein
MFPEHMPRVAVGPRDIIAAVPPPPGVIPSFDHPEFNGRPVVTSSLACIFVATLALCMRLYTRAVITKRVESTDRTSRTRKPSRRQLTIARCICSRMGMPKRSRMMHATDINSIRARQVCSCVLSAISVASKCPVCPQKETD